VIVYLHGFNSSPESHKARVLQRYLADRGMGDRYACPALPVLASDAVREIERMPIKSSTCLVGSSLGGFYATYLAEKHGAKAVLLNPAVEPHVGLRAYLGPQKNLHTGAAYELTPLHLEALEQLVVPTVHPERYLLIVETGDEVLDYRHAVSRYAGARQIVVQGGDHALQSFAEHLPEIVQFAGLAR